jgi:molybdopterin synthase catalytic subunit
VQVRVLLFGVLKDLAGRSSDTLSLPDHATAADVISHYSQHLSKSQQILNSIAISVNQEYARPEDRLRPGDEVALLPPVSGGANTSETNSAKAFITREKIDGAGALDLIKRAEDGAAVLFEGVVRNHSRGRRTMFLEYEAYEQMALKELESLIAQALKNFQIRDAIIIHRLGRLEIGETSVLIVVASAHRAPAFDACRWLIDTLKRTVPIWKKEHFEDGAIWSDGEPFPSDIVAAREPATSKVKGSPSAKNPASIEVGVSTSRKKAAVTHPEKLASNPIAHK